MAEGWEIIESVDIPSATSGCQFQNIPQTYFHLMVDFCWSAASSGDSMKIRINSDSGNNYDYFRNYAANGSTYQDSGTSRSYYQATYDVNAYSDAPLVGQLWFTDYRNSSKFRQVLSVAGNRQGWAIHTGSNKATTAISNIYIYTNVGNNIRVGSHFQLWGLMSS